MATSQELIQQLRALGLTDTAIGNAVGRDSSLVYQIAAGRKPGHNLNASLDSLRGQLAAGASVREARVPEAPRRTIGQRVARVRRPTTVKGASWSSSTIKRQATRSGGRSMLHPIHDAAQDGRTVAVTATVAAGTSINSTSGSSRAGAHAVTMELGDAEDLLAELDARGDDVTAYIAEQLAEAGHISFAGDPAAALDAIELRAY